MSAATLRHRLARSWAFIRHMPPDKLARRVGLTVRRRVADTWPALAAVRVSGANKPRRVTAAPRPIFPPRAASLTVADGMATITFLGRTIAMPMTALDWGAPAPGPAHQLWRMNLHYMEYLEAVPDALFGHLVTDWVAHHPAARPGAWRDSWNSYALSLRVVVWMQQLAARPNLDAALVTAIEASLVTQLAFLARNLETDLGGNHLIKNLKALAWGAAFFDGEPARAWQNLAIRHLKRELPCQILPDGMHNERSASYHCQVFADLLECRAVLTDAPQAAALISARLPAMAQAIAELTYGDGGLALFNDAGLTMAYAPQVCLAAYAAAGFAKPTPRPVFALPAAGYYGLHAPSATLVVDCGRIAPDDLPAHGHGDVLAFELCVGGHRVFVDQGVFEYIAGPRRAACRAAANHNTVCLKGADQADFFGAFRCGRRPNVAVRHYEAAADGFVLEGSHDGFADRPGKPIHVRRFEATPTALTIIDTLEGSSTAPASATFLLHPAVTAQIDGTRATLKVGAYVVTLASEQPIAIEAAVWWSDMGYERATHRLRIALPGADGCARRLRTHLHWDTMSADTAGQPRVL